MAMLRIPWVSPNAKKTLTIFCRRLKVKSFFTMKNLPDANTNKPVATGQKIILWTLPLLVSLAVAWVFISSGFAKLEFPVAKFIAAVAAYKVLPASLVKPFALFLPAFEIVVAVALFVPKTRRVGIFFTATLSFVFLVALAQSAVRGLKLPDCGCMGGKSMSIVGAILKNILLLAGLAFCAWANRKITRISSDKLRSINRLRSLLFSGVLIFVVALLTAFAMYFYWKTVPLLAADSGLAAKVVAKRAERSGADGVIARAEVLLLVAKETPGFVLVDARPASFYTESHLKNAINVPVDEFEMGYARHRGALAVATRIIVYCNGGGCEAANEVVKALRGEGVNCRIEVMAD